MHKVKGSKVVLESVVICCEKPEVPRSEVECPASRIVQHQTTTRHVKMTLMQRDSQAHPSQKDRDQLPGL